MVSTESLVCLGDLLTLHVLGCSLFIEDIGPKMNNKIEVFLENDQEAYLNKYH